MSAYSVTVSFNSRPHTEVDSRPCPTEKVCYPFNSRPHTEVDRAEKITRIFFFIFQLTTSHGGRHCAHISLPPMKISFNSRPHTEVDNFNLSHQKHSFPFNSRPHTEVDARHLSTLRFSFAFQLTTSHGGRPSPSQRRRSHVPFNSRPHTEVDCTL